MMYLSPFAVASIWSLACFVTLFVYLYLAYRGPKDKRTTHIFFNPQDYARARPDRPFPEYSKQATFDPFITQYTGMAKVVIALAAASISFGGLSTTDTNIFTAKMLLAYSIAFSLIFCISVINFYENYLHDLKSYTPIKIAFVESSGLTCLVCFALGYGYWAWHL
jgi:hypothetical protein